MLAVVPQKTTAKKALGLEVPGFKKGPGRARTNWRSVIKKDLQRMGLGWEEVEVAALDRQEWRRNVAQVRMRVQSTSSVIDGACYQIKLYSFY